MPKFHFHLKDGTPLTDANGTEMDSLDAARREACQRLIELALSVGERPWTHRVWQVDVTNAAGLLQFSLMLTGTDAPSVHSWSAAQTQGSARR
ncbi:DUF6894 family protein [Muricoccus radiodurans]|uniref:DUF6894 family protein n=1 Tax=Muricoccus radiodurans TaxID=2231721 RepID=UPI003CED7737